MRREAANRATIYCWYQRQCVPGEGGRRGDGPCCDSGELTDDAVRSAEEAPMRSAHRRIPPSMVMCEPMSSDATDAAPHSLSRLSRRLRELASSASEG